MDRVNKNSFGIIHSFRAPPKTEKRASFCVFLGREEKRERGEEREERAQSSRAEGIKFSNSLIPVLKNVLNMKLFNKMFKGKKDGEELPDGGSDQAKKIQRMFRRKQSTRNFEAEEQWKVIFLLSSLVSQ